METVPLVQMPAHPDLLERCREAWRRGEAVAPLPPGDPGTGGVSVFPDEVPEGTALVLRTSGTTGVPKAVMLGHDAIWAAADLTNEALGATPGDRWLCCLPLHRVAGIGVLLRAAALGTEPVVHERFEVGAVRSAGFEFVSLVPTMLVRLLDGGVELSGRTILLGGGPIPAELVRRAEARGARVVRSYGMTETCGGVVYDGLPLRGVEVAVDDADSGRIVISSPTLMLGYAPDVGSGLRESSFPTSDSGRWADGRLEVVGRLDRIIVTGGENVSAAEVEGRLRELPGVSDAFVFGRSDPVWGEAVVGLVVTERRPEELLDELKREAPGPEVPKALAAVEAIPLDPSGAPDRTAALEILAREADRDVP